MQPIDPAEPPKAFRAFVALARRPEHEARAFKDDVIRRRDARAGNMLRELLQIPICADERCQELLEALKRRRARPIVWAAVHCDALETNPRLGAGRCAVTGRDFSEGMGLRFSFGAPPSTKTLEAALPLGELADFVLRVFGYTHFDARVRVRADDVGELWHEYCAAERLIVAALQRLRTGR